MDEHYLISGLAQEPSDWQLRLQLAELMYQRQATEELVELIQTAPIPPASAEQLNAAVAYSGVAAQQQAEAFIAAYPNDAQGHFILGQIYETLGHAEHAQHQFQTAQYLGMVFEPQQEQEVNVPVLNAPQPDAFDQPETQIQSQALPEQQEVYKSKNGKTKKVVSAVFAAVVAHVIIIVFALWLTVFKAPPKEATLVGLNQGPQSVKQEMVKKNVVKQVKKSSSSKAAAAPVAKLMKASAVAAFSLPEVTVASTGPLGLGDSGFGSFGGGGTSGGLGSGGAFFGNSSTGQRFLFVLDHSKSMRPHQVELRNKELERALKSLDDSVQYQVLLFAGGALFAQKGWKVNSTLEIEGPKKTYKYQRSGGFRLVGNEVPTEDWLDANSRNRSATMRFIENTPLFLGTDWRMALQIGHNMSPAPDVIFFMADGTGGNNPAPILEINRNKGRPVINTVAMQTTKGAREFNELATKTQGSFTIVDKNGKPISGEDFFKDPNKVKSRLGVK